MYPIMNQSNNRRCLSRFQTHKHKHTQSDGCTAEQCDCDERALLTRLRFRFARLPVTAPGQQVEQQSDQRHDQQRSWYRRQNSQTLFVCVWKWNSNVPCYKDKDKGKHSACRTHNRGLSALGHIRTNTPVTGMKKPVIQGRWVACNMHAFVVAVSNWPLLFLFLCYRM